MNRKVFVNLVINDIRSLKGLPHFDNINSDTRLREDLFLSSFDLAELTVKIEDEFDIDVFDDGLVNTVGEIYAKLSE